MRPQINIRFASDDEGQVIRGLVADGYDEACKNFNWTKIHPWWLVAETKKDGICACMQVLVGFPTSAFEFLSFKKGLPKTMKALITKKLAIAGLSSLKHAGASAVFCTVPFHMTSWKKVLKNHWNGTIITSGNMFFKRLD